LISAIGISPMTKLAIADYPTQAVAIHDGFQ
jgi:hypothetical protein